MFVSKGIRQVKPLNSRLTYMELVLTVKTEYTESTGQGSEGLRGSKTWYHFHRVSGWRAVS